MANVVSSCNNTSKMKSFIVLFAVFVLANALDKDLIDKLIQRAQKAGAECKESSKAPDSDIQLMLEKKVPATHEGKCMVLCMHKEFGVQSADGKLDKAGAMKEVEKTKSDADTYGKLVKIVDHCMANAKHDSDPCETAVNYQGCALKKADEFKLDESILGL